MKCLAAASSACIVIALAGATSRAAAQSADAFGLAMTRLELNLDLDYGQGSLSGWASYRIANLSGAPVNEVPYNVGRLMTVRAVDGPGGGALSFEQDVTTFVDSPRRQVNHVVVSLAAPLAPGASVVVKVHYGGFLVGYTETGSLYIKDRVDETFSILREDAFAWPVPGTLSQQSNRVAPRPDFSFLARITVPQRFTVASGGRLVSQDTADGRTTFVYQSTAPVPFLNLPVAEYSIMRRQGLRVYYFPQDSAGARRVLEGAARGLATLEQWFGKLGTAPELAVMEIPDMWGSQASLTGGIIQTADAFRQPGRMSALYHELTHLWNAPDLDQPSARWNEGLATFLARRMAAVLDGWTGMEDDVRRTSEQLIGLSGSVPKITSVPFARYGEESLTDLSYRVGFLMFHALHQRLGDARFDAAIGRYYQEHWRQGGTFKTLLEYLQRESPTTLDSFFQDWVHTTGWYGQLRSLRAPAGIGLLARPAAGV